MDPFVYSDIFDTKGIEYIIVIFFLLLIIPFWRWLARPVKQQVPVARAVRALTADILKVPQGLYFNRNHTWSSLEPEGAARIGVDDLLLHLTGGVEVGFLQGEGARIEKGDPLFRITRDGKALTLGAPVSGTLTQLNKDAGSGGSLAEDPYDAWLCKLRPDQWQEETGGCYLSDRASSWMKEELLRFKDFLSGALSAGKGQAATSMVLQEGGELTDFPLAGLDEGVWKQFQEKFLEDRS